MSPPAPLRYLLDTNILVAYIRAGALGRWIEATYQLQSALMVPLICVVTQGEIHSLALQRGWGAAKMRTLHHLIRRFVSVQLDVAGRVEAYARIDDHSRRVGRSMGKNDAWIAATAHVTGARLLTTDRDFDHLDPTFLSHDWVDPSSHP